MKKAVFAAVFLVAVAVVAFLAGCNADKPTDPQLSTTNGSNPVSLKKEGACGTTTWDLTAGQTIDVGSVTVENDADNLYVTYTLDYSGACFGTLHLWVGDDLADMPQTGQGSPIPGQFPYQHDASGQTTYTFEIPLSDLGIDLDTECENTLYVVPHAEVDLDCSGGFDPDDHETAFGGDTPGGGPRWWFYGVYTTCCPTEEECWEGETAWAAGSRYVSRGNWATYTSYSGSAKTVTLYAGQTMVAGTVHFSAPSGGNVTITICLNDGWRFDPDEPENVKIQDYATAPSGNPSPGLFAYKGYGTDDCFDITVPRNNFYGVHVDVERQVDCPE
jgi:hypothetical protein